jgi:hypothetical protein
LKVGDVDVAGTIEVAFETVPGCGFLQARGNFPSSDFVPLPGPLDVGQFQYSGAANENLCGGDSVVFDIAQGNFAAYATNVRKV